MKCTHSDRLERWLGAAQCEHLSALMRGWYGTPIAVSGVPGAVYVNKQGDFEGRLDGGQFASLDDYLDDRERAALRRQRVRMARRTRQLGGFANLAEAISWTQHQRLQFNKNVSSIAGSINSSWRFGNLPVAGAVAAAAPGGTVPTSASTGALPFTNPATGTTHFLGVEATSQNVASSVMLYDRLFAVVKTMNSTATEAVTGVPTRYQSTVQGAADSAENNFLFAEVGTTLAATAHNWTVCQYTDQSGNAAVALPSVAGVSAVGAGRVDHTTWWMPLASGDTGIQRLTRMQCDALVATGAVDFVIGHPIAWIPVNPRVATVEMVRDERINNTINLARIFDNACLAFLGTSGANNQFTSGQILIGAR